MYAHLAGHPNYMTDEEYNLVQASSLFASSQQRWRINANTATWWCEHVFSRYPSMFGEDSARQRTRWHAELTWAATIVDTRAYSPRFDGDAVTLIPLLDLLNHADGGSPSFHIQSAESRNKIVAYGKFASRDYAVGDEVWASYVEYPQRSACNQFMFRT